MKAADVLGPQVQRRLTLDDPLRQHASRTPGGGDTGGKKRERTGGGGGDEKKEKRKREEPPPWVEPAIRDPSITFTTD